MPGPPLQADVAVIDQNIFIEEGKERVVQIVGTDLCQQLHARGFTGVTCVLSGSDEEAIEQISALPGVDMAFEKGASLKTIAACIRNRLQANARSVEACA